MKRDTSDEYGPLPMLDRDWVRNVIVGATFDVAQARAEARADFRPDDRP